MSKLALVIKTTCQPGKRDQVRTLWEKHLKPGAIANDAQEVYFYCHDDQDENVLYLFEIYSDREAFGQAAQSPAFAGYMQEVGPLLAGEPQVGMATPLWAKGASI